MPIKKRDIIINVVIILSFCVIIISLPLYGVSKRTYSASVRIITIPEPYDAFKIWEESGVKGRVLILFDRYLNAEHNREVDTLARDNYVYTGMRENIIRKVYHVIPDNAWPAASDNLTRLITARETGGIFRLNIDGSPVFVMRMKDIPMIREKALISINGDFFDANDIHKITEMLRDNFLNADIITLSGNLSQTSMEEMRAYGRLR